MEKLKSLDQFEDLKNHGKVIFMFSADWCPDCRFIEPALPEIIEKHKDYTFIYVDRDEFIELCGDLGIFGIPSFVAYHNGEEAGRYVNKDRKTQEQIEDFINGLAG